MDTFMLLATVGNVAFFGFNYLVGRFHARMGHELANTMDEMENLISLHGAAAPDLKILLQNLLDSAPQKF